MERKSQSLPTTQAMVLPSLLQMVRLGKSIECGGWGGRGAGGAQGWATMCVPTGTTIRGRTMQTGHSPSPRISCVDGFPEFHVFWKRNKKWPCLEIRQDETQESSVSDNGHCLERQQGKQSQVRGESQP